MKIATLLSFLLLFFGSLHAQGPDTDLARRQAAQEQLTAASPGQFATVLEEKRARLVEAISDADLESAGIMQQEVLDLRDQVIALGGQKLPTKESDRMQDIREALAGLPLKETAHEADQLVLEFLDLVRKTSR